MSTSIEVFALESKSSHSNSKINNQAKQTVSDEYSEVAKVANFVENLYKPNFILRESRVNRLVLIASGGGTSVFGDILPFYKSQKQLAEVIVLTRESLITFLLSSRTFFVCTFSFFSQIINSATYQSYLIFMVGYDHVLNLPERYNYLRDKFYSLVETFAIQKNRELWWLSLKIESKVYLDKLIALLKEVLSIVQKFYLATFVLVCLFGLFFAGQANIIQSTNSVRTNSSLSKFVDSQSVVIAQFTNDSDISESDIARLSTTSLSTNKEQKDIKVIFEHTVKEGETVSQIAAFYGLKPTTVRFNNRIADGKEPEVGNKLFLPWFDSYIYKTEDVVTAEYLSNLYAINKDEIIQRNINIINREKQHFEKGSLVLIPSEDFTKIELANKQEEERKENLRKAEEERKRRSISSFGNTYRGVTVDQARSEGLIWPVSGNFIISRCVQPGHIACDFADPSEPPIFAAKDGVVSAVYRYTVVGYGLAVVIDHGNGLKTLYAHLSEIYVEPGDFVKQGASIGRMGCTGWCTGTHLHFEVIQNGVKQNPLLYLS